MIRRLTSKKHIQSVNDRGKQLKSNWIVYTETTYVCLSVRQRHVTFNRNTMAIRMAIEFNPFAITTSSSSSSIVSGRGRWSTTIFEINSFNLLRAFFRFRTFHNGHLDDDIMRSYHRQQSTHSVERCCAHMSFQSLLVTVINCENYDSHFRSTFVTHHTILFQFKLCTANSEEANKKNHQMWECVSFTTSLIHRRTICIQFKHSTLKSKVHRGYAETQTTTTTTRNAHRNGIQIKCIASYLTHVARIIHFLCYKSINFVHCTLCNAANTKSKWSQWQ